MKKNVIAVFLTILLATSSIGTAPVLAAEATAEGTVALEEARVNEEVTEEAENAETGPTAEESFEAETVITEEENPGQKTEEPADAEMNGEGIAGEPDEPYAEMNGDETAGEPDKPDESADTAVTSAEFAAEEDMTDSANDGETSEEIAEIEEPLVIEEEIVSAEENEAALAEATSGKCGEKAYWKLTGSDPDRTLTIYGSGPMTDFYCEGKWGAVTDGSGDIIDEYFYYDYDVPWFRMTYKRVVIEKGITGIGDNAFFNHYSLSSVSIPSTVTSIGKYAFYHTGISSITFPSGLIKLKEGALSNCKKLKSISIPAKISSLEKSVFSGCSSLTSITIPTNIKSIKDSAFEGCTNLTNIKIPSSVTSIGAAAFRRCSALTDITIPGSVTGLSDEVFSDCPKLTVIKIPGSVKSIGSGVFQRCSKLSSITIPSGVTKISNNLFMSCGNLISVTIPQSVTSIGDNAFRSCVNLTNITIPSGVRSLGANSFDGCKRLSGFKIPSNVKSIGEYAFANCISLTSISVPDNVTEIGNYTFYNCSALKNIALSKGLTGIGNYTFAGCGSLTNITIPNGVTSIGGRAFFDCKKLTNVTIPSSVTGIGDYPFPGNDLGNDLIVNIFFNGSQEQWNSIKNIQHVYYKSITFAVVSSTFSTDTVFELEKPTYNYTGNPIKPGITVTCSGKQLLQDKDYKLTYENNTNIGMATVNITGIGEYSDTAQLQFRIRLGNTPKLHFTNVATGMKVSWEKVSGATRYKVYRDGILIFTTSSLAVTDKDVKYMGGTKFTYTIVATEKFTGDSELSKSDSYYRLMPVGIKSLSNPSAGKMTVTYDKSAGCYGYVVRYGFKQDMSDAKVVSVQGQNTTSRTFGSMKKGKTYYVQVRTYMLENGVRYYSGYCTTKTITIKK